MGDPFQRVALFLQKRLPFILFFSILEEPKDKIAIPSMRSSPLTRSLCCFSSDQPPMLRTKPPPVGSSFFALLRTCFYEGAVVLSRFGLCLGEEAKDILIFLPNPVFVPHEGTTA
jgi:hypothetical protein